MTTSHDPRKGIHPASGKVATGLRATASGGPKGIHLKGEYPPGIHLENGQNAEETQSGIHRIHLNQSKGLERGVTRVNRGIRTTIGAEVDTVDTAPRFLTVQGGRPTAARKDLGGRLVACGESGQRVGEDHHHSVLSNAQVEEIRDRFEAYPLGDPRHEGYRLLAREYECSKSTIRNIVHYRKRNVFAAKWKRLDK